MSASRAKIASAIHKWERSKDINQKTMPDEIPLITPRALYDSLQACNCLPIDVREKHENVGPPITDAVRLSYFQLSTEPDKVVPLLAQLREDGRILVLFSQRAERMAICGILSALF